MTSRTLFRCLLALGLALGAVADRPLLGAGRDQKLKEVEALQDAFTQVADKVFPSLVSLTSFERTTAAPPASKDEREGSEDEEERRSVWREVVGVDQRYPGMRPLASATGFAMSADGYVLTSLDFLKKPDGKLADLVDAEAPDGRIALCQVVGTEPSLNLAVLKLEVYRRSHPPVLEPVAIADHSDIRVGNWAIAVGDPRGPQRIFAAGLISARPERDCYQADLTATFLEASLQVHPEAYGGPLVDIHGAVVGMIVPHRVGLFDEASSGLVYALPMSIATGIFESLKLARSFESPFLGVAVLNMTEYRAKLRAQGIDRDLKEPVMGVYIDNVFDPSPAALAGVQVGDILLKLNGLRLSTVFDFQKSLYLAGIGNTVAIELYRDGQVLSHQVTIAGRPAAADSATEN